MLISASGTEQPMKLTQSLLLLSILGLGLSAHADTFVDPHPYQTQTLIRYLKGENPAESGTIYKMQANASDYTYWVPGEGPQKIPNTPVMYAYENGLAPISVMGGNYFFFKDNTFGTLSADGIFTYNPAPRQWQPGVVGGVFYTKQGTEELVMIDSFGNEYSDTKIITPNIRLAGGNFFIDEEGYLTTFKSAGEMMTRWNAAGNPKYPGAFAVGGNYFAIRDTVNGKPTVKLVTIDSQTGFYSAPFTPDTQPKFFGGNYYIDQNDVLFTVDSRGISYKTDPLRPNPIVKGYSYILYGDGSISFIDHSGAVRDSMTLVKNGVGTTLNQLNTDIELSNVYLPNYHNKNHCN